MEDKILVVDYFEKYRLDNGIWICPYYDELNNRWWLPYTMKAICDQEGINYTEVQ